MYLYICVCVLGFVHLFKDILTPYRLFNAEYFKARSRRYPAETMTDTDYADDLALLTNTPAQVESIQHSLSKQQIK